MRIPEAARLFAWEALDDSPSLAVVRRFLAAVPDAALLASLRRARGKGRDDYPVDVLWGVVLLTGLLRHPTIEATLGELGRNEGLRRLIGIESEAGVPNGYNVSRFLTVLGTQPHLTLLHEVFNAMIRLLGQVVGGLGEQTAGDSSGLSARLDGKVNRDGLSEPTGGTKEYTDAEGKVTRVLEWFGYKFHLLVDVKSATRGGSMARRYGLNARWTFAGSRRSPERPSSSNGYTKGGRPSSGSTGD